MTAAEICLAVLGELSLGFSVSNEYHTVLRLVTFAETFAWIKEFEELQKKTLSGLSEFLMMAFASKRCEEVEAEKEVVFAMTQAKTLGTLLPLPPLPPQLLSMEHGHRCGARLPDLV